MANTIYFGDNLEILKELPSESVDLIYIDPPFNTGHVQSRTQVKTVRDENGDRVGFGGQSYIPSATDKLAEIRAMIDESGYDIDLEVDGGVKPGTARQVIEVCSVASAAAAVQPVPLLDIALLTPIQKPHDDVGVYCREETGGMMLVGSLDPPCDAPEWVDDPDAFDYSQYFSRVEGLGFGTRAEFDRDIDDPKWLE